MIEFNEGVVCFAGGCQWLANKKYPLSNGEELSSNELETAIIYSDYQLNTPCEGWYIHKSEIDTEQKYNDVVEVFGLFGAFRKQDYNETFNKRHKLKTLTIRGGKVCDYESSDAIKCTYNQLMAIGKLKRMIDEKSNSKEIPNSSKANFKKDGNKYHREIIGLDGKRTTVVVYRVLDAFTTNCPATDHAIKKMLCAGLRGHKDKITDYENAIESLEGALSLLKQKG